MTMPNNNLFFFIFSPLILFYCVPCVLLSKYYIFSYSSLKITGKHELWVYRGGKTHFPSPLPLLVAPFYKTGVWADSLKSAVSSIQWTKQAYKHCFWYPTRSSKDYSDRISWGCQWGQILKNSYIGPSSFSYFF